MEWAAELWLENCLPLHIDDRQVFGLRWRSCRFSERMRLSNRHHAVLTELMHETGCRSKDPHWNCGVRFGTQRHI